ncbi:MAG: ABC-type transport auxiliary lipoprotein family protein [Parvibaculum sp.]
MSLRKMLRAGALMLTLAPLGACALANVAGEPAPDLYVLTAPSPQAPDAAPAMRAQIVVDPFSAPAALDTARIVFQPSPNEIKYYAGARWSDRAPRMIAALAVETLHNTGRFPAVIGAGSAARTDLALTGDVRQFAAARVAAQGLGQTSTEARVVFFARLLRASDRSIVASREFSATAPSASGKMTDIVAAYDAALGQVLSDIALWTLDEGAKAWPKPASS